VLTTNEASSILEAAGVKLSPEQVAELARNQAFPKAFKDEDSGRWTIPGEDIAAFIRLHKRKRRRRWITAGTITFIITALGLLSIAKDTMDLVTGYVFPTPSATSTIPPTATPIPTPAPILCVVVRDSGITVSNEPYGEEIGWIPKGGIVQLRGYVAPPAFGMPRYEISHFSLNDGDVRIVSIAPDSPAQQADLQVGDIILQLDNLEVSSASEVRQYIYAHIGDQITFHILRDGQRLIESVYVRKETERPSSQGPIGMGLRGGVAEVEIEGYITTSGVSCQLEATP
jgi:membrane-associated protease RseP (regulator of RpoE activity)